MEKHENPSDGREPELKGRRLATDGRKSNGAEKPSYPIEWLKMKNGSVWRGIYVNVDRIDIGKKVAAKEEVLA